MCIISNPRRVLEARFITTLSLYAEEAVEPPGRLNELLETWKTMNECRYILRSLREFIIESRQDLDARTAAMF